MVEGLEEGEGVGLAEPDGEGLTEGLDEWLGSSEGLGVGEGIGVREELSVGEGLWSMFCLALGGESVRLGKPYTGFGDCPPPPPTLPSRSLTISIHSLTK